MRLSKPITRTHQDGSPTANDTTLWAGLKAGDRRALSAIYTQYFDVLYDYSSRLTLDSALVQDCIQDLFVEIWNKRETISDVFNIKMYLYKSVRRKIIHQLTHNARAVPHNDPEYFEMEFSGTTHFLKQTMDAEISSRLKSMVEELTPKQKEAIFLIYFEELSYDEASVVMGLKTKTLYNLIHLALSKLREKKAFL